MAERGYYADGGGLYFRVSEFGTRLWAFRYTHDGRAREMALATSLRWHSNGEQWRTTLVTYADPVIGRLLVRDLQQAHQVDRAVDLVEILFGQAELLQQRIDQGAGTVVGNLKAHAVTELALPFPSAAILLLSLS